jgi:hypothetical protein
MTDIPIGLKQSDKAIAMQTQKRIAALEKEVLALKAFRKDIEDMLNKQGDTHGPSSVR